MPPGGVNLQALLTRLSQIRAAVRYHRYNCSEEVRVMQEVKAVFIHQQLVTAAESVYFDGQVERGTRQFQFAFFLCGSYPECH